MKLHLKEEVCDAGHAMHVHGLLGQRASERGRGGRAPNCARAPTPAATVDAQPPATYMLPLPLLLLAATQQPRPVPKSLGWFTGRILDGGAFLLSNQTAAAAGNNASSSRPPPPSVRIADRMLPCCGSLVVTANGTLPMTATSPYVADFSPYLEAGMEILADIRGEANVVEPMFRRKDKFAQEMLALAVRWNLTGFTLDWEFGQVMNWSMFNETMTVAADLLHAHGKKIGVCVQSGCGDDKPAWAGGTDPACSSLFRNLAWADKLTDMGTYPMWNNWAKLPHKPNPMPADQITLHKCHSPQNQFEQWCGLEGQVLNHISPKAHTVPQEYAMGAANGQYSAGLWPKTCEQNGTVAGAWTQPTLHAFLSFLDRTGVRSIDVWCTDAAMPCSTIDEGSDCFWFTRELAWWKAIGQ